MQFMIDKKIIEAVIADFERDNPTLSHMEMSSKEFGERFMEKLKAQPQPPLPHADGKGTDA